MCISGGAHLYCLQPLFLPPFHNRPQRMSLEQPLQTLLASDANTFLVLLTIIRISLRSWEESRGSLWETAIPTSYGGRAQWASAECRVQVGAFLTRDSDPRQCLLLIFKQTFTARELLDHQGCRTATIKHMYHIRLRTYNIIFRAYFSVWLLFPKRTELFNKACSKVNATISE